MISWSLLSAACALVNGSVSFYILPSLGRLGEDYDVVSRLSVEDGFRVLRPQRRSDGGLDHA